MLSKSLLMLGKQCHKALWLKKHKPELQTQTKSTQDRFERGITVGELAQNLFPNGTDISKKSADISKRVKATRLAIEDGITSIYEATFCIHNMVVSIDILHKDDNGCWHIYEVKSSTSMKKHQLSDAAIQYFVACEHIPIESVNIVYVNNKYNFNEQLDIQALFNIKDITDNVMDITQSLPSEIEALIDVCDAENEPDIGIGSHCNSPHACSFQKYCKRDIPKPSVFNLYRMKKDKKFNYYKKGIVSYEQLLSVNKLNRTQRIQINTHLENTVHIDHKKIERFLNKINYPISYFDFETYNEAIPRFNGQRPYMQMPFQYSLHIEKEDGSIIHKEFLGDENSDPRYSLVNAMLKDIPESGSIMAYNQSFEITRIKELAKSFPSKKAELESLIPRFIDLLVPFRTFGYYHPKFHGSFSIKSVLPAMFPDDSQLDYKALTIQNGEMAMNTFANLPRLKNKEEREQIRNDLLEYCKLDTLAMIRIFHKLKQL